MENIKRLSCGIFGSLVCFWGVSLEQADHIVSLVCCILGMIITITSCVVIPVWKKIREAYKDKHITPEELEDITNTLKDGVDELERRNKK